MLARFAEASIDVDGLDTQLQGEGAASFVKSWNDVLEVIESKYVVFHPALKAG